MIRTQQVNSMVKNIIMIVSLLLPFSSSFMMTRPSQCGVATRTLLRNSFNQLSHPITISEKSALSPQFTKMYSTSSSSSSSSSTASSTSSSTSTPTTTTSQNQPNQTTIESIPIPNQEKVNIYFETMNENKSISINKGEILRTALMKRGVSPHNGQSRLINCRGLGTCGTCAVEVKALKEGEIDVNSMGMDAIQPKERTTMENIRLNFPPHGSEDQSCDLRLACQIQVYEDFQVTKKSGFWGQSSSKGDLAEEYDARTYFGDLEYILDDKSPEGDTDEKQS